MTSHAGRPWDEAYTQGSAPWDIGRPQPALVGLPVAGAVLDAGCGTGEHALHYAAQGLPVLGVDAAPTAIAMAREKAVARGLDAEFVVGDALRLEDLGRTFDTVLDCGLFHTFAAGERRTYAASLAAVTCGSVHLLCFSDAEPRGPHPVAESELRAAFAGWRVLALAPSRIETDFGPVAAWLAHLSQAPADV